MQAYRLQQYLLRGQNIKHLNKHYEKIVDKQRFDKGLFDVLAADTSTQTPIITGIHIADDEPITDLLAESIPWMKKHEGKIVVITQQPKLYAQEDLELLLYKETKGRHTFIPHKQDNELTIPLPSQQFYVQAADYLLSVAEKKSPLIKVARKLLQLYTQQP